MMDLIGDVSPPKPLEPLRSDDIPHPEDFDCLRDGRLDELPLRYRQAVEVIVVHADPVAYQKADDKPGYLREIADEVLDIAKASLKEFLIAAAGKVIESVLTSVARSIGLDVDE